MSSAARRHDLGERASVIAAMLRERWYMIERVDLRDRPKDDGYEAAIHLDRALMRAAADQQGLDGSPASTARAESRRLAAISTCIEWVNANCSPEHAIRRFHVVD